MFPGFRKHMNLLCLTTLTAIVMSTATGCGSPAQTPSAGESPTRPIVLDDTTSQALARDALGQEPVQSRLASSNIPVEGTPVWTVDFGAQVPTEAQLATLALSMASLMPDEPIIVVTGVWEWPVESVDASGSGASVPRFARLIGAQLYWNRTSASIANPLGEPAFAPHSVAIAEGTHSGDFAPPGVGLVDDGEAPADWLFVTDVSTSTVGAWATGRQLVDFKIDPEGSR